MYIKRTEFPAMKTRKSGFLRFYEIPPCFELWTLHTHTHTLHTHIQVNTHIIKSEFWNNVKRQVYKLMEREGKNVSLSSEQTGWVIFFFFFFLIGAYPCKRIWCNEIQLSFGKLHQLFDLKWFYSILNSQHWTLILK